MNEFVPVDSGSLAPAIRLGSTLALATLLCACGDGSESQSPATTDARDYVGGELQETTPSGEQADVEALRALGYAGYTESSSDELDGVLQWDPERSYPGYNLYLSRDSRKAELIDAGGALINTWSLGEEGHWARVRLLADGDLLVIGSDREAQPGVLVSEAGRFLARLSWENEVRWIRHDTFHHDIVEAPDGRFLTLSYHYELVPEVHPTVRTRIDSLTFVNGEGEIVEKVPMYEILRDRGDLFTFQTRKPVGSGAESFVDLFHSNTVGFMRRVEGGSNPMFSDDHVIITMRNQDAVVILNWKTRELVWAFGPEQVIGPHDGKLLDNGHLLVFDNGLGRGWSRVLEVEFETKEIVWQMRAPVPSELYSKTRGGAVRLPNGNTLITSSDQARAFEITPEGQYVWRFLSPTRNAKGKRSTMNRMQRYEVEFIERLIESGGN